MNDAILSREVSADIKKLEEVKETDCDLGKIVPGALIRALRLGEAGYFAAKRNYYMLVVLLLLTVKADVWSVIKLLAKLAK